MHHNKSKTRTMDMEKDVKKAYSSDSLFSVAPRPGLLQAILARIDLEKIRQSKRRFIAYTASSLISFGLCIAALKYMFDQFGKSEFPQYFSLAFSDKAEILTYWKQFLTLLTESLPLMSILLALTTTCVTLYLLRNLAQNSLKGYYQLSTV